MRVWHALLATIKKRIGDMHDDQRAFLPAALEIIETPPSPTGRLMSLLIVTMFSVGLGWAFLGHVDVTATAPGKIVPAGEVKIIQSLDPGIVTAIRVKDGDHVRAGQLLLELDATQTEADFSRYSHDLIQAKLDVARLSALAAAYQTGRAPQFDAPVNLPPNYAAEGRAAMMAQYQSQIARLGDLSRQIEEKRAHADEIQAEVDKLRAQLPMHEEKVRIHRELTSQGYGTSLAFLDAQQQAAEARHELDAQSHRKTSILAALNALVSQRDGVHAQYLADVLSDLRKAEAQDSELTQQFVKARQKNGQTALVSPVDGVVEQLAVHTLRGVVSPAQKLMIVVPSQRNLTVEAQLANRDVGFVHPGQSVKIKVETFTFTRYGFINGRVIGVSRDTMPEPSAVNTSGGAQSPAGRTDAPPAYVARVALDRTAMTVDGRIENLQPGMAVTAEIKTGDRTIIDYILSPIARRTAESLHEQ